MPRTDPTFLLSSLSFHTYAKARKKFGLSKMVFDSMSFRPAKWDVIPLYSTLRVDKSLSV